MGHARPRRAKARPQVRGSLPARRTSPAAGVQPVARRQLCRNLRAMTPEPSDEILMQSWAAGDASAFEVLYRRHRSTLYGFLMRSLGRRDQADDCFQDVWSRVIRARGTYRPEAKFTTWLLQIAHHLLIDRHRRQRPDVPLDAVGELEQLPGDDGSPEAALSQFERHRRLRQAMAALPPEQRHALLLRLDRELSLEQIGEITGAGRETVKSRLRYAMDKLKDALS
jgi:RNA polymerase sigma-70 factor (ECF subfamily)